MTMRYWLLVAACACGSSDSLPDGDLTRPDRVVFEEADTGFLDPHIAWPTAVGGTRVLAVLSTYGRPAETAYRPVLDSASHDIESTSFASVTLRAHGVGDATLRAIAPDGAVVGEARYESDTIAAIAFEPRDVNGPEHLPPDAAEPTTRSIAFFTGDHVIGIGLYRAGPFPEGLLDNSLVVDHGTVGVLTSFNTLHVSGLAPGTYPITVTAAGRSPTVLDLVMVDHADTLTVLSSVGALHTGMGGEVCFEARAGGRYVVGLPWRFAVTGPVDYINQDPPNCITVMSHATSGQLTIEASAGGLVTTTSLAIAP